MKSSDKMPMRPNCRLSACVVALILFAFNPCLAGRSAPASDGAHPYGALVQGSDGNFYGTTVYGGSGDAGTVFQITAAGALTILHSFPVIGTDGVHPCTSLIQGSDGNFYGTTVAFGSSDAGTVFMMTPAGVLTTLHSFTGNGTDGANPEAGLVQGSDGSFYGTTREGGSRGRGTVFKITPAGVLTTLHSFKGKAADRAEPWAGLVQGSDGNFYGTTVSGSSSGPGKIFKMMPAGLLTSLHTFPGDAGHPSGLIQGSDGNFYGTTSSGGGSDCTGMVFKITPEGAFTALHTFTRGEEGICPDGFCPISGVIQGSDGTFYGAASNGGIHGGGTVFKITPAGAFSVLARFTDGRCPFARLVQGSDGNFYGTTVYGGGGDAGTVFRMTPEGVLTTLHCFGQKGLRMKDEG